MGVRGAGGVGVRYEGNVEPSRLTERVGDELGSPYWCPRRAVLRCIDRVDGELLTLDRRGTVTRHATGAAAALVRPRAEGGVIIAAERELVIASRDDLADLQPWGSVLADARLRFVDGACSPTGRLYLGTVGYQRTPGIAMVFRLDPGEASGQPVVAGLTAASGIAWSPDRSTCYVNDDEVTWAFDYRPHQGVFGQRQLFGSVFGPSDSLTVDADGGLWVAHTGAGLLVRRTAEGDLTHVVELPGVTACAFGGSALRTLYCAAAGAFWTLEPGMAGLPTMPFRGELPRHYT